MDPKLFDGFAKMLDKVPEHAVIRTAQAERRMLEDDLAHKRTLPLEEANSILTFCNFLDATLQGSQATFSALPPNHVPFYRQTVERLVEAGELPAGTLERFDANFSRILIRTLRSSG